MARWWFCLTLGLGLIGGLLTGTTGAEESLRSVPKDTTPYVRHAIPEDYPGTRPLGPLPPSAGGITVERIVDVVVSNTDPDLKNTEFFNDSEPSIAVNPANPNQIVITAYSGGWGDFGAAAPLWHSVDGGVTWTKQLAITKPPGVITTFCPCNQNVDYARDNVLAGTFLAVDFNAYSGATMNPASSAWTWPLAFPGHTQRTNLDPATVGTSDQPWIVVNRDPVTAGQDNVYVAYDNFNGAPTTLHVSVSPGVTYPPFMTRDVQMGVSAGAINPGHRLARDPRNGSMYSLFQNCVHPCALDTNPKTIEYTLNRTTDAGVTWSLNGSPTGIVVATAGSTQPIPKFGTVNSLLGGVVHGAVDPSTGDLYYAYGNRDPGTGKNRLAIRRVVDVGAAGVVVQAEHFVTGQVEAAMPAVAVTDGGVVGVFYYTFDGFVAGFPQFTAHLGVSMDAGVTFTDQPLLTFLSSAADNGDWRQRVFGDYVQMKAHGDCFYGAFTGNGIGFGRPFANHDPIFYKVCASASPPAPTLAASPNSVAAGGAVTATWSGIASPTSLDWLGLYLPGAGNTAYLAWRYVSCSQVPGSPVAAGSCSFPIPGGLAPGTYELRLLANNGYTRLATSNTFTVTAGAPPAFDYSLGNSGPISVTPGSGGSTTVTATLLAGSTQAVNLSASGLPAGASAGFDVASCSPTCSSLITISTGAATPTGTFPITVTGTPLNRTTTFNLVVNPPGGPTLGVSPTTVAPGGSVMATWAGIVSPTATDWVGLYLPGAANTAYLAWIYVSCTQAPGSPVASGACSFPIPGGIAPGTYQLRLLANNGYTLLATSNSLTVASGASATLSVSPSTTRAGGFVTATWSGIPSPTGMDWIGLYAAGAADTAPIARIYVSCSDVPGSPAAAGSCPFRVPFPLAPGAYELRLFSNNGFSRLATSNPLTVN